MKDKFFFIIFLLIFFLIPTVSRAEVVNTRAPYLQTDENISITEPISGEAYIFGNTITIDKEVDGDLLAVGESVTINAPIRGDLRVIASKNFELRSQVMGSTTFISPTVYISPLGEIDRDAWGVAQKINMEGRIGRDLNLKLAPNADIRIDGKIMGDFYYSDSRPNITERAVIEGKKEKSNIRETSEQEGRIAAVVGKLFHSLSLILIALLILKFRPSIIRNGYETFKSKFGSNVLRGFITLILAPIIILFLTFTFFGIPLALFIAGILAFTIYISPIMTSIWIGQKIFSRDQITWVQVVVGILVFDIVTMIPVVSVALYTLSVLSFSGLASRQIKS